jgi:transcriptional regulator with XRE-family HTH domain
MSSPVDLLSDALAAIKAGDIERASDKIADAFDAEPRLRRAARHPPKSIEELMPLLRQKEAAGPVVRRFRQSLGLTQERAAEICQISREFLAQIETGRKPMPQDAATRLINWMAERGAQAIGEGPSPPPRSKLRQLLGLTQSSIAAKLGFKETIVRRVETGNMPVSLPVAAAYRQLAQQKGLDLDRLAA